MKFITLYVNCGLVVNACLPLVYIALMSDTVLEGLHTFVELNLCTCCIIRIPFELFSNNGAGIRKERV